MLTPDNIKNKSFQTTGRGSYRAEDVDGFFLEVSASYEQMYKENADLIKKISILAKKVEEYRADEDSLKMALLRAQKLADNIVAEAKETAENEVASVKGETEKLRADAASDAAALEMNAKNEAEAILTSAKKEAEAILENANAASEKILADANAQAKTVLGNINRKVTHESLVYEMIQKESTTFKARLVSMYKEHINLINKLPEIVDEQLDKEEEENAPAETQEQVVEPETTVEPDAEAETTVEPVAEEVVEEVAETEETIEEQDEIVVIEKPEEVVVDEPEEVIEEAVEEVVEAPVAEQEPEKKEKSSFKFDFDKIDFEEDEVKPYTAVKPENFEVIIDENKEEAEADKADESASKSFRNFFKKK